MVKGRASLMKVLVFSLCVDAGRLAKSSCPEHAQCLSIKGKPRLAASRSVDSMLPETYLARKAHRLAKLCTRFKTVTQTNWRMNGAAC